MRLSTLLKFVGVACILGFALSPLGDPMIKTGGVLCGVFCLIVGYLWERE